MAKAVLLVFTQATSPEQDEEFNTWYDKTHLGEVCEVPGFTAARRYVINTDWPSPGPLETPKYLAIYEIEADDIPACMAELEKRGEDGTLYVTETLQLDPMPKLALFDEWLGG